VSAVLELVQPTIEECEEDFTSAIGEVDDAVSRWLVASELQGDVGALDHYLLVRGAAEELREALDSLEVATAMMSRHDFYANL
jgi:hypothetical protein